VTAQHEKLEARLNKVQKEIPAVRELTEKRFDQEPQLAALKVQLADLEAEIARNIADKQKEAETEEELPLETLDHSENLRPLRSRDFDGPDYPANGLGR